MMMYMSAPPPFLTDRDLKPENLIMTSGDSDADLGTGQQVGSLERNAIKRRADSHVVHSLAAPLATLAKRQWRTATALIDALGTLCSLNENEL